MDQLGGPSTSPLPLRSKRKSSTDEQGKRGKQLKLEWGQSPPSNDRFRVAMRPPPGTARKMQALKASGLRLEKEGRLEDALSAFKMALISCSCNEQVRRQFKEAGASLDIIDPIGNCSCKDFLAAAQTRRGQDGGSPRNAAGGRCTMSELNLAAVYDLATKRNCTCGSGRVQCKEPDHFVILERLTSVARRLGRHKDALNMGQWLIDLGPEKPQGYFHVAKIVIESPEVSASKVSSRFVARCLYNQGMQNVATYGDPESGLAKALSKCCSQYGHGDYIPELAVETVESIFQHLSQTDFLASCRVSKTWNSVLRKVRIRLPKITLRGKKSPDTNTVTRFFRRFPHLEAESFAINYDQWRPEGHLVLAAVLHHFNNVERFELGIWPGLTRNLQSLLPGSARSHVLSKCQSLTLTGFIQTNHEIALDLLRSASATLETLEMSGCMHRIVDFPLPRLKRLKVTMAQWTLISHRALLPSICMAAPCLEVLHIGKVLFIPDRSDNLADYDAKTALANLHTLIVEKKAEMMPPGRYDAFSRAFPLLPKGMRCIDLACENASLAEDILFPDSNGSPDWHNTQFAHLEAFRCTTPYIREPQRIFDIIGPSLGVGGKLSVLELNGLDLGHRFLRDPAFAVPFPERIRTIGLYNFNFDSGPETTGYVPGSVPSRDFLTWLARFPNLEAVAAFPAVTFSNVDGALVAALVEKIGEAKKASEAESSSSNVWGSGIRTIYQNSLSGMLWSVAQRTAQRGGFTIVQEKNGLQPVVYRDQQTA